MRVTLCDRCRERIERSSSVALPTRFDYHNGSSLSTKSVEVFIHVQYPGLSIPDGGHGGLVRPDPPDLCDQCRFGIARQALAEWATRETLTGWLNPNG